MTNTDKIKRAFGRSAGSYEKFGTLQREVSARLVREFTPFEGSPQRALDIGCGTGFTSTDVKERWPTADIHPLDLALPMAKRTHAAGFIKSVAGDASSLPYAASLFDIVVSSLALQWGSDYKRIFSEIFRTLKPGGLFSFSVLLPGTLRELRGAYDSASRECTGKGAHFPSFTSIDAMTAPLKTVGFRNLSTHAESVVKSYSTVGEMMRTLKGIGATNPARPENPPRRDVLARTMEFYPGRNGHVEATYEISYISCVKG